MNPSMNYKELLEHSYQVFSESSECPPENKLQYVGDQIFNFTTYDSEMSELFARKAIEVCKSINDRNTFEYIKDKNNYLWYLLMCNMQFFSERIEYGTSIRGAWWRGSSFNCYCLFIGNEQCCTIDFTREEWESFVDALIEFTS